MMKIKFIVSLLLSLLILETSFSQSQWNSNVDANQHNLLNLKKLSVLKAGSTVAQPTSTENRIYHSENFNYDIPVDGSKYGWGKDNLTLTGGKTLDVNGDTTLEELDCTFIGSNFLYQQVDVEELTTYYFSWDFKRGTATNVNYGVYDFSNYQWIISPTSYYNLTSNLPQRITVKFKTGAGCTKIRVQPFAYSQDTLATPQVTYGTVFIGRVQIRDSAMSNAEYIKTTDSLILADSGSNVIIPDNYALVVGDNANVGIGTATPMAISKLNVHKGLLMLSGISPGWGGPAISFTDTQNVLNGKWGIEYEQNAKGLNFGIPWNWNYPGFSNYNLFLKDTTGYVGINNPNPTERIDINGNVRFSGALLPNNSSGTPGQILTSEGPGSPPIWKTPVAVGGSSPWTTIGSNSYYTDTTGRVCIGANIFPTGYRFAVNGDAIFKRVTVKSYVNWPDYVFLNDYELPSLKYVEAFIKANRHLPDLPAASEVEKEGIDIGSNQAVLLKKIEELTLYLIEQQKQIEKMQRQMNEMKKKGKK